MNLRFVEAFYWVASLKSVTRAAEKLFLTQSAMSSRIAALEEELGVLLHKELQAAVKVPVISSSLMQLPRLLAQEQQVGVLTISAASLDKEHLRAAGVPRERLTDVIVQGVNPKGEFATRILGNQPELDLEKAAQDVVDAALALKQRAPGLRSVVLECTNMPPYRQGIEQATGFKTFSLADDDRLLKPFRQAVPLPLHSLG